jgi:hypothetical protein
MSWQIILLATNTVHKIKRQCLNLRLKYLETLKIILINQNDCQIFQVLNNTTYITGFELNLLKQTNNNLFVSCTDKSYKQFKKRCYSQERY